MLTQAILIGLVAMCVTFEWALGTCLASRPIVTGVLIGLVMGDLQTGIIVGATLEMVFIGSVTIGAAVPPDVITGGILGTAFAISTGQGAEVALTLAFPIASLYLIIDNALTLIVMPFFVHSGRLCGKGRPQRYGADASAWWIHRQIASSLFRVLPCFLSRNASYERGA